LSHKACSALSATDVPALQLFSEQNTLQKCAFRQTTAPIIKATRSTGWQYSENNTDSDSDNWLSWQ